MNFSADESSGTVVTRASIKKDANKIIEWVLRSRDLWPGNAIKGAWSAHFKEYCGMGGEPYLSITTGQ